MKPATFALFPVVVACLVLVGCPDADNTGGIGEYCDGSTGIMVCKHGLVCAHNGTCQDPGTGVVGEAGEGESCNHTDDCGYGLVCGPGNVCIAGGIGAIGEACGATEDCQFNLVCSALFRCERPGSGQEDTPCTGAQDCAINLVCAGDGTCQDPADPDATGVAGPGDACESVEDCRLGLICYLDGQCRIPELWQGVDCSASSDAELNEAVPFKAYFEVPRAGQVTEFYRLPFPNDIRLQGGKVYLAGHPAPDTPMAEGLMRGYLAAIQEESTGFSTQGTAFMRFSKWVDFSSVALGGDNANFYMLDIDADSPNYGLRTSFSMFATTAKGRYICQNWMGVKPMNGYPLRHSTTYALIATNTILSDSGAPLERDDDFDVMMSDSAPTDVDLLAAWQAYQPLRDFLDDTGVSRDIVMGASVFTTMDPDAVMAGFRDKIRDCTGGDCALLPGPEPANLALESEQDGFYLVNGSVDVPVFQQGTPPYYEQGGKIEFDAEAVPIIQGTEPVSFTLSVPTGTPPPDGWPVVLFAHGTGGSSRSAVDNGVARELAEVDVTLDTTPETVRFAVLGIEGVQHGNRRGGLDLDPEILYFNFLNPHAAKYNAVQGAADNFQLVRLVETLQDNPVTIAGIPDPVKLDAGKIFYFGHSQGSMTGPLFLAYSPVVNTTVLSGAGGNLIQSLLTKTQPVDIAGATKLLLGDPNVGSMHPMLNLLQIYFDPVDVVNYGGDLTHTPLQVGETDDDPPVPIMAGPKNVFMSFGRDDHYSTEATLTGMARSMWLAQADGASLNCQCDDPECDSVRDDGQHDSLCMVSGLGTADVPVRANGRSIGVSYTAVLKMFLPDGYDGHFVLLNHVDGPGDYSGFLGSAVVDPEGIPTLFP